MTNIYSRLYRYREREARRPLEDFLTEALADLFARLDAPARRSLLALLLPRGGIERLESLAPDLGQVTLDTQVSTDAPLGAGRKRPDMVLKLGTRPLMVIEVKLGAGYQSHILKQPHEEGDGVALDQLETYARWIATKNQGHEGWPGAIALLTAWRDPPEGFGSKRDDGVLASTARWKLVSELLRSVGAGEGIDAATALARDLHAFLKENALMTKYPTSRDLAAAQLAIHSLGAIQAMCWDTFKVMAKHVPKLSVGRNLKGGFEYELNLYWGWVLFATKLCPPATAPYVAFGVCFELPSIWKSESTDALSHEPFAFVVCGDENERERVDKVLSGIPGGWVAIQERKLVMVARPLSSFSADPDARVDEMQDWAKHEVDRLVAYVPGYEEAPSGPAALEAAPGDA